MFHFLVWGDVNSTKVLGIGINFYHPYVSDKKLFKEESPRLCSDGGKFSNEHRIEGVGPSPPGPCGVPRN